MSSLNRDARTKAPTPGQVLPGSNVLGLSWVSLLNDLGSEVLTRLVPIFVSSILGAPMSAVGAIEGLAESTATLLKPFFGSLSDRIGRRKPFMAVGYGLSSLSRPLLAFAGGWGQVALVRFSDRLGKGIRTGPRDALIAQDGEPSTHGRNFGINRAFDNFGAMLGIVAFAAWNARHGMAELTQGSWRSLVWACSIPGFGAWAIVVLAVKEKPFTKVRKPATPLSNPFGLGSSVLRRYFGALALFSLANSSDAFILLRAKSLGCSLLEILGLIALFNVVAATSALPAAILSDRLGRKTLIAVGWLIYACAYGVFGLVTGVMALPANIGFGWIWDRFGSSTAFLLSAAVAGGATCLLMLGVRDRTIASGIAGR